MTRTAKKPTVGKRKVGRPRKQKPQGADIVGELTERLDLVEGGTGELDSLVRPQPLEIKQFLQTMMNDVEASPAVRVQAAKALDAIEKREAGAAKAGLASLTRAQVRAEIARVRAELGG